MAGYAMGALFVDSPQRLAQFFAFQVYGAQAFPWDPPIITPSMLAEITALLFSVVALALSAWLYVSSFANRSAALRTERLEAKSEALRTQLEVVKKSLQEQQEKLAVAPPPEKARPAVVADASTIADWNNNANLRELLKKHGYAAGPSTQKGK